MRVAMLAASPHQPPLRPLALLPLILILQFAAADYALIPTGSAWKYDDSGNDDISAGYQSLTFDDSGWPSGSGPLGYGYADVITTLLYGSSSTAKYMTTYFRKTVNVYDYNSTQATANISVQAVHGARCFLNAVEVTRKNLPNLAVLTTNTSASSAVTKPTVALAYSGGVLSVPLLLGANVFACDVHLFTTASSSMRFDAQVWVLGVDPPSPTPTVSKTPAKSSSTSKTPSNSQTPYPAYGTATASPTRSGAVVGCSCACSSGFCCTDAQLSSCSGSGSSTTPSSSGGGGGTNGSAVAAGILVPLIVIGGGYIAYRNRAALALRATALRARVQALRGKGGGEGAAAAQPPTSPGATSPSSEGSPGAKLSRTELVSEIHSIRIDGFGPHASSTKKGSKKAGKSKKSSKKMKPPEESDYSV